MSATTATPTGVLLALVDQLKQSSIEAARQGIKGATELALEAETLVRPLLYLDDANMLSGLDSVRKGLQFGLARIAEERARAWFKNLIDSALGFAGALLGGFKL